MSYLDNLPQSTAPVAAHIGTAGVQFVAMVFLIAGIKKLYSRKRFSSYLSNSKLLNVPAARATARLVPEVEIAIGITLISGGGHVQGILIASIALLVAFTLFQIRVWRMGMKSPCPCGLRVGQVGAMSVTRNLLLIGISALAMNCVSDGDLITGTSCAVRVAVSLFVLYFATNTSRTGRPAS